MGLKYAALLLLLGVRCDQPPKRELKPVVPRPEVAVTEAPEGHEPLEWNTRSADTHALLTQKPVGKQCALRCELEGKLVWEKVTDCQGRGVDRRFVSNDCEKTVILDAAPATNKSWRETCVMRVFLRDAASYRVFGPGVLDEAHARGARSWLKGCFDVPGEPPHYSADGSAVELTIIDGKTQRVPLSAKEVAEDH